MIMLCQMEGHMFLRRLATRQRQPELMDQQELNPDLHRSALRGLARINRLSLSARILWPSIRDLAIRLAPERTRVLDIACGGGDVAIALAHRAVAANLPIDIVGCDISPVAIDFAKSQAGHSLSNLSFMALDALNTELPCEFDVITCSLFLHHLGEDDAIRLLHKMAQATRHLILVNDLARSRFGYLLAWVGTRLLSRSPIVHFDGPVSVEGAFTAAEALRIAEAAGLNGATVRSRWPCRYLLRWGRP